MAELKPKKFDQADSDMDSMADRLARAVPSQESGSAEAARPVTRPGAEHPNARRIGGAASEAEPVAQASGAQAAAQYIAQHTVAAGETLSHIALKYYGSAVPAAYMHIYEANKAQIGPNPGMIRQGTVLNIPPKPAL